MFNHHVFISYAHIDNLPLSPEQEGWISRFHQTFSVFLSQRLGGKARIWRDLKLQGNDIFSDEIVDAYRDTALLISILSPRYLRSEWCRREISEFCAHAETGTGLVIDNKARVFKIVKTPVQIDGSDTALPAVVRDSLGYDFYVQDEQGPIDLDPDFGESFRQDYLRKICIVANNAAQLIEEIEARHQRGSPSLEASPDTLAPAGRPPAQAPPTAAQPSRRTVVFLAAVSFDQRDLRELIEADLRSHGYRVLPEARLPSEDEQEHRQSLLPLLAQADCSVHLIGSGYGAVPDGPSHCSLVETHNSLAAARSREHGLRRLIWMPEGLQSDHESQRRFLTDLRQNTDLQAGADLLDGSLEDLRTLMHTTLDRLENPAPQPVAAQPSAALPEDTGTAMVYLICVQEDRKPSLPLRKWLKQQGFEVLLPAFEGDAGAVRAAHEALLRDCQAVLVFYGAGDEAWYRSVKVDLRRAPVYRDGRSLPPSLTVLASPDSDDKQDMLDLEEPNLVDARIAFETELLQPLLLQLGGSGGPP